MVIHNAYPRLVLCRNDYILKLLLLRFTFSYMYLCVYINMCIYVHRCTCVSSLWYRYWYTSYLYIHQHIYMHSHMYTKLFVLHMRIFVYSYICVCECMPIWRPWWYFTHFLLKYCIQNIWHVFYWFTLFYVLSDILIWWCMYAVTSLSRQLHSPTIVAVGLSVGYETRNPIGWHHRFMIGWFKFRLVSSLIASSRSTLMDCMTGGVFYCFC